MNNTERIKMKYSTLILVCAIIIATLVSNSVAEDASEFSFYATYDKVFRGDYLVLNNAALSSDGSKLIISGYDKIAEKPVVFMLDSDGSNLVSIPLPEDSRESNLLAINHDGSLAFFVLNHHLLFKVEGGAAIQILDANKYHAPVAHTIAQIGTTADGDYVYYMGPTTRDGIWRIGQRGGDPEKAVDPAIPPLNEFEGSVISSSGWAVSDEGNKMVFSLFTPSSQRWNLITVEDASFRRVYNPVYEDKIGMSGDGNVVIFTTADRSDPNFASLHSIAIDGSDIVPFAPYSYNFVGPSLTYNGSKVLYADATSKGRLANIDGSGVLDIFPTSFRIPIGISKGISINSDGTHISFIYDDSLYVGYLNGEGIVSDAPVIEHISFEPLSDDGIILKAKISHPQGLSHIVHVTCTELIEGKISKESEIPIVFSDANDKGDFPDQIADDGIYTSLGKPGGNIENFSQMTVRVAALDQDGTVTVADIILSAEGS